MGEGYDNSNANNSINNNNDNNSNSNQHKQHHEGLQESNLTTVPRRQCTNAPK